jgi:hypothetical protein
MAKPKATIALPDLENENLYVRIPQVAILDEDTDPSDPMDQDFLKSVIAETNDRIQDGELILLTIGHTDERLPETEQPPLVGYAKNLKLGELNGKDAILADFYIQSERYEEVMSYPRRSVELWHDKEYESGHIDIVSFLLRAPARSLGLLTYRNYGHRTRYNCPILGEAMTTEEMEALANLVVTKLSRTKLEKDDEEVKEDTEVDKESVAKKKKVSKKDKDDDTDTDKDTYEEDDDDDKEKDANDASCASGSNTFVPGMVDDKKAKKMRRDSDRIKLSRLESMLGEVAEERDRYKLMLRRSERERDLKQLEAEGYQFDPVAELAHTETLDDAAYATHISRARTLYRKFPVGKALIQTEEPKVGTTKEEINEVLRLAAKNNVDFETALNTYKKSTEVK